MKIFNAFFDLFFPPRCIYCNSPLVLGERPLICRKCMDTIPNLNIRCGKCDGVLTYNSGRPECLVCKTAGRYFDGVFAPAKYIGNVRTAILKYKFAGQAYMAKSLVHFTTNSLKRLGIKTDIVLSVPPDTRRQSKRGFDSTGALAKIISGSLKIPYKSGWLKKVRSTPPQSRLTKSQRLKNVKGAFGVTSKARVDGLSILLIDDVFTTGATTSEIAKILKKKGAKYVFVATLARK